MLNPVQSLLLTITRRAYFLKANWTFFSSKREQQLSFLHSTWRTCVNSKAVASKNKNISSVSFLVFSRRWCLMQRICAERSRPLVFVFETHHFKTTTVSREFQFVPITINALLVNVPTYWWLLLVIRDATEIPNKGCSDTGLFRSLHLRPILADSVSLVYEQVPLFTFSISRKLHSQSSVLFDWLPRKHHYLMHAT